MLYEILLQLRNGKHHTTIKTIQKQLKYKKKKNILQKNFHLLIIGQLFLHLYQKHILFPLYFYMLDYNYLQFYFLLNFI